MSNSSKSREKQITEELDELEDEAVELEGKVMEAEDEIEAEIQDIDEKIEWLNENVSEIGSDEKMYVEVTRVFLTAAREISHEISAEKEIKDDLRELEQDKEEYKTLVKKVKSSSKLDHGMKESILKYARNIPFSDIFSSASDEEKRESNEEDRSKDQLESLIEIGEELEGIAKRSPQLRRSDIRKKLIRTVSELMDLNGRVMR